MTSDPALAALIDNMRQGGPDLTDPPEKLRPEYEALFASFPIADDLTFSQASPGDLPGLRVSVPGSGGGLVLYLHGGGYVVGSAQGYRGLAGEVARAAGMDALVIDYRLAPEHPFPAAVDDALAAYRALLEDGRSPGSIVIAGDSAGGGLALALLVALREAGDPMPAAAFLISPWADLTCSSPSIEGKRAEDVTLTPEGLAGCAAHYLGGRDRAHPLASPALTDLSGLPPLLVQVGSIEILLDDALAIAARAGAAGTQITLEVLPGLPHVFHAFHFMLPQAKQALDRAGVFLKTAAGG